ncbi:MAG TPA: hypothetical protein VG847_05410 [Chitinophagaceae bacterium]|nr:hypothetical protein [Chitinophagaceae bacterium]
MKSLTTVVTVFSILLFSCNTASKKVDTEKESYQKTREDLRKKEEKDPKLFLTVTGDSKKNLIGQTVIKGSITNKASIAVFKDVDVNLSFYSKTSVLLETDKETIFEILHPGETKDFKTKYFAPKGTDSVAFSVAAAKVMPQ